MAPLERKNSYDLDPWAGPQRGTHRPQTGINEEEVRPPTGASGISSATIEPSAVGAADDESRPSESQP
jgi:hypothetical protein